MPVVARDAGHDARVRLVERDQIRLDLDVVRAVHALCFRPVGLIGEDVAFKQGALNRMRTLHLQQPAHTIEMRHRSDATVTTGRS
jgi:hypothetical protein